MKTKLLIAATALLALVACTKNEPTQFAENKDVISFQTAKYMAQTKAAGSSVFTYYSFGVYAWSAATAGKYFMDNESVTYQGDKWLPSTTYYWPREASVDFVSYYPRVDASDPRVKIEPDKITYSNYSVPVPTVDADGAINDPDYLETNDLMYADKVVGLSSNGASGAGLTDGKSSYSKVPAYFRHALAKLNVNVRQSFRSKTITEASGATTRYKWEVKINSASIKGVDTMGNLELNLSGEPDSESSCLYPWKKPANELWSDVSSPISELSIGYGPLDVTNKSILSDLFVMPQALAAGKQQLTVNMTIITYRSTDGSEPTEVFLSETCSRTVNLYIDEDYLPTWKMNHNITYNLVVVPTAKPKNPGDDPDDPNLDDIVISFDPAVDDWTPVNATASLML